MNKVDLIGRLTKDVDLRYTQDQKSVSRFTLAVNRMKKDDGADFINCVAWDKTADLMNKYVHKGDQIGLSGHIKTGSYDKDGHKVYTLDVVVDSIYLLGGAKQKPDQNAADDSYLPFK